MKFWDSSAIVPLLVQQASTKATASWHADDPMQVVWWSTVVECESAIARLVRHRQLEREAASISLERLYDLANDWFEIEPSQAVRDEASRLLRTHSLRAADSLQLGAALFYVRENGETIPFVCLDDRLRIAARSERLPVVSDKRSTR